MSQENGIKEVRRLRKLKKKPRFLSKRRLLIYLALGMVAMLLLSVFIFLIPNPAKAQDDYTFGTENFTKGTGSNPTGKNTEDGTFESLFEADQYADTNFTGSSENIVTGTGGGAAFPGALTTDDASRRSYTEADSGGGSPTYQVLRPGADGSPITFTPTPSGTHYTTVDETTAGGNGDTDYVTGVANGNEDTYAMSDATGSGNFDVTMWHWSRGITTSSCAIQYGLDIGGTNYLGGTATMVSISYANFSYTWTVNPATLAEWSLSEVNALGTYLYMTDANPDTRTTQVAVLITLTPAASYTLDAQITYSSVASTSQTTGFQILCQGYRNGDTESVNVQAWNYTSSAWVTKATISAGSDTDYDFNLLGWAANCERSSGDVVLLRAVDASNGDATQTVVYFDVLKVRRVEQGYAMDIDMSATAVAQYGNITLRIKGYTSAEQFNVNVYNYTSAGYDAGKLAITSLSNTWQTTIDLCDAHHRSGTTVKIQFTDNTVYTADTTADILYLDVAWITRYHTDPTLTLYGALPQIVGSTQAIVFFANYSDYDNDAPTFIYVNIDTSDFSLSKNDTGDVSYHNGVNYSLSKSDLSLGEHTYYFRTQDAASGVITTASAKVYINATPALSADTVLPATGNVGQTFNFTVSFNDTNGDMPTYMKANIDAADYVMLEVDPTDLNTVDTKAYYYNKVMSGGNHPYYFKTKDAYSPEILSVSKNLYVNSIPALSVFGRTPGDPVYVTTQLNFTCTFTDVDNDLPSSIKWREDSGTTQNVSMTQIDPYDLTTTDGKTYFVWVYLGHGNHNYDHYASDSLSWTSGGSNSITIQNRAPVIDNGPGASVNEWRNTFWQYDFNGHDDDSDSTTWGRSGVTWLTINSGGLLSGTTTDTPGDYPMTVYLNDSYGGQDTYDFTLHVINRAPDITNGPGAHIDQWRNTWWDYDFDATDADTDSMGWEKSGASWLFINAASGLASGTTSDTPGLYSFVIYANDSYGGSDTYLFDIHIENRAPIITNGPGVSVNEWRNVYWQYDFDYSDDDGDSITWGREGVEWLTINAAGLLSGDTTDVPGDYPMIVYANDSYSGQDTYPFTLHVLNRLPTITSAGNTTQQDGTYMAYYVTATDGDSDSLSIEFWSEAGWLSLSNWWVNGTAAGIGFYQCKVWVNDSYDSDLEAWQVEVTVAGNQAPTYTSSPIENVGHPVDYYYDCNATDPEFDPLTFDILTGCSYIDINPSSGLVSGNIPIAGWWYVNISVTDGTSIVWQNYTLTASNTPPAFDTTPTESWQHGTTYTYDANAHDDDGDSYSFGLSGNCTTFLSIIPGTGVISGIVPTVGWWYLNVSVSDSNDTTWQYYVLTGLNTAPTFTTSGITEWQNGTEYVYDANGNDVNSDVLSWYIEGNGTAFLQVNSTTGVVNGTIPIMGWWYLNISLNDSWSSTWQNFTLYGLNTPPDITTSPGLTGAPGVEYSYDANANDVNGDTIEWGYTEKPVWMVIDPVSGICTGIPVIEGSYDVKLLAWDGTSYDWQNWTIVVAIPVIPPEAPPTDEPDAGEHNPDATFQYTIVNNKIILKDTTYGATTRRQWDFGDGTGSQESTITHTYLNPGDYTITLTVWHGDFKSIAQVTLHIGSADEWRIEKGNATWEVSTPIGDFEWNATISLAVGAILVIMSFGGQKFPILKSKYVRGIGIVFLVIGMAFYAL